MPIATSALEMWDPGAQTAVQRRRAAWPTGTLVERAKEHLLDSPLVPAAQWAGPWLCQRVREDPALLWALGGLRPTELLAIFHGSLDQDALGDLSAAMAERILATMRWLGLGCVETALSAGRAASLHPALAGRIGRTATRTPGGSRLLSAAGLADEWIERLRGSDTGDRAADGAVRAVYGAHRPALAELRLRAFSAARWDPAAQPVLREAVLALHGLNPAPTDSLVRLAVGGHPWGNANGTTAEALEPRARVRILLEVMRRVDGIGLGPATGLCLLAGLPSLVPTP